MSGRIPLEGVEDDNASASFNNGVLTVKVPKSREAKKKCDALQLTARVDLLAAPGSKRAPLPQEEGSPA